MAQHALSILLWFSAIGAGVMAGIYFAFSVFIMRAFAAIPEEAGIRAMQSINTVILRSLFMPLFFGTTLAAALLAVLALFRWNAPGSIATFAAGLLYVFGMFVCTAALNVPLNNALASVDAQSPAAADTWARYRSDWTRWNHVRTAACTLACGLYIWAITAH